MRMRAAGTHPLRGRRGRLPGCLRLLAHLDHSSGRSRTGIEVRCRSLRDGYRRFDVIESDPDVKAIREHREFKDALTAAKTLRQ